MLTPKEIGNQELLTHKFTLLFKETSILVLDTKFDSKIKIKTKKYYAKNITFFLE